MTKIPLTQLKGSDTILNKKYKFKPSAWQREQMDYVEQCGYNECVDQLSTIAVVLDEEEIIQNILDSMTKESERNKQIAFHKIGYKYSPYCSCGMCHIALLGAKAITQNPARVVRLERIE